MVLWFLIQRKNSLMFIFSSVQFSCSVVSDSLGLQRLRHVRPPCPSPTPGVYSNSCPLSQWCHPTISSCHPFLLLPPILPSIRVFSNESTLRMRWPKYWSLSFSIIPSKERPGLISFRMDWLDLLGVQGTLKSLLQHHSSKASILQHINLSDAIEADELWLQSFGQMAESWPHKENGYCFKLVSFR